MSDNDYISRELYEADKQAAIAKHEAISADIRTEGARMKGDYNLINERINNMDRRLNDGLNNMQQQLIEIKESQDRFFRNVSLALTGMTLLFTVTQITIALITIMK